MKDDRGGDNSLTSFLFASHSTNFNHSELQRKEKQNCPVKNAAEVEIIVQLKPKMTLQTKILKNMLHN